MLRRSFPAALALSLLVGCGESPATLHLDLSEAFAITALPSAIQSLTVRVEGRQMDPVEVTVNAADPSFDLEVPAGPLYLQATGRDSAGIANYYGDLRIAVSPSTDVDVVLPIFPAGELEVSVLIAPEKTPSMALITFVPQNAKPDESRAFDAKFIAGVVARVLPADTYDFHAEVSFNNGKSFSAVGTPAAPVSITAGVKSSAQLDLTNL